MRSRRGCFLNCPRRSCQGTFAQLTVHSSPAARPQRLLEMCWLGGRSARAFATICRLWTTWAGAWQVRKTDSRTPQRAKRAKFAGRRFRPLVCYLRRLRLLLGAPSRLLLAVLYSHGSLLLFPRCTSGPFFPCSWSGSPPRQSPGIISHHLCARNPSPDH
jgi:hypothetical protein